MTVLYTLEKMSYTKAFGLRHVKVDLKERVFETDFEPKQKEPKEPKEQKETKAPDSYETHESKPEEQDDLKGLAEREHNA